VGLLAIVSVRLGRGASCGRALLARNVEDRASR
jgi:hypothetical protein